MRCARRSPPGEPVVALETTLVAHGFPAPQGVEVGLASERRVREAGAVPATIGVLDGQIRVGLTEAELHRFTPEARKCGPRDLAAAAVQGVVGGTTVGGTVAVARSVGIRFMGTGGLGGVHRGWPLPPDVSADLGELARTEVLVVSSGIKSLLDVPSTTELLETLGVPVLGFRTDELPLFYAARGGPPVSARVESADEAARIARAHWTLGRAALVLARAAGREPGRRRAADRARARRGGRAGRDRAGGHAVRARVPPPRERRPHRAREPRPDRRQRRPRGRDRRGLRRALRRARSSRRRSGGARGGPRASAPRLVSRPSNRARIPSTCVHLASSNRSRPASVSTA